MSQSLTERYDDRISGVPSCHDRLVITGTLPAVCYAAGMTGYPNAKEKINRGRLWFHTRGRTYAYRAACIQRAAERSN
jgi:hypothetical protein